MIALSIALNDYLFLNANLAIIGLPNVRLGGNLARGSQELADRHLFSLMFMLPLIGVCSGLLKHNWYVTF